MLTDRVIKLRALEPEDALALFEWENLSDLWQSSCTLAPYSRRNILRYIEAYEADPFRDGQLRLIIESVSGHRPLGLIDLYDLEVRHRRACVAILIEPSSQRHGYASRALALLENYCRRHLGLHQLLATVPENNSASLALFNKPSFTQIAILPHYIAAEREGAYLNACIFNKILTNQPN